MSNQAQLIEDRYDNLMFAKTPERARVAARELAQVVLGDEASDLSLEESLRRCCRILRPAPELRDQSRFEAEFIELGIWPNQSRSVAA